MVTTHDSQLQVQKSTAKKKAERPSASAGERSGLGVGHEGAQSSRRENNEGQERVDLKAGAEGAAREPEGAEEEPVAKSGKRKAGDEIDSIFGTAKKKGAAAGDEKGVSIPGSKVKTSSKSKSKLGGGKEKQKLGQKPKAVKVPGARKRTNDGLTVYSEEELGFAKKDAGGTPLCPFDCQCCF
ncbi:hypothetical protein KFL_004620060 [Klebsormidium nitens]|uniref:DUF1764 domain-containing protein n=1 Tax=Klebsormidium nitens TaxID=105231 RepID=A0A1Y1IJC5_KLENI|nr:hypothetical protein KFL_004620060 [Klebsormidium nitens]|eukprot:GAQ88826.1 hypothetical protein KFL_004620060 [Klebsormidium nitens]